MYTSCIFCSARLGSNELISSFPVGRSIAFDAKRGRLWAMCRTCGRWNLAPIEERWEPVELAESAFRKGKEAHALLRRAMVHVNGAGAGLRDLRGAVDRLETAGSADSFLLTAARDGFDLGSRVSESPVEVARVDALAFEMALNEESERNALHGELAGLMQAWREAEEIASIADSLFDDTPVANELGHRSGAV